MQNVDFIVDVYVNVNYHRTTRLRPKNPGGRAGRPMLEVLRHQNLQGVLATVVRYHGRIPLGAGGLVRACTHPVAQVLLGSKKHPSHHS